MFIKRRINFEKEKREFTLLSAKKVKQKNEQNSFDKFDHDDDHLRERYDMNHKELKQERHCTSFI